MQQEIDRVKPEYDEVKRGIGRNGWFRRSGHGTALMTLEANSEAELARNFLGLGDGLRVSRFTLHAEPVRNPLPQASNRP